MYKSILTLSVIASLMLALLSCSSNRAPKRSQPSDRPTIISISKANTIIEEYLQQKHLAWGEATMIRNAPNKYIYNFATPKQELEEKGPRRLVIDIITGKIKLPTQSGGLFGNQPKQKK